MGSPDEERDAERGIERQEMLQSLVEEKEMREKLIDRLARCNERLRGDDEVPEAPIVEREGDNTANGKPISAPIGKSYLKADDPAQDLHPPKRLRKVTVLT